MEDLAKIYEERGSVYKVGRDTDLTAEDILETLRQAAKEAPTAFNSQSTRYVLVTG